MNPTSLLKLASLNLTTEQMAGVLEILAVETVKSSDEVRAEEKRERDRSRLRRCRATIALQSGDTSATELEKVSDKESFPHTPFKEINLPNSLIINNAREGGDFQNFWFTYPKREGNADKKAASKAFFAALKRVDPLEIIAGAARYAAFCDATQKTGTSFVRQARTWINAEGWNENYVVSEQKPSGQSKPNTIANSFAIVDEQLDELRRQASEARRREAISGPDT